MLKNEIDKNCKIFHIVFSHHRVQVTDPVKKSRINAGEEARIGHHCSYTSVKCVLGGRSPKTLICVFQNPYRFVFSGLNSWL